MQPLARGAGDQRHTRDRGARGRLLGPRRAVPGRGEPPERALEVYGAGHARGHALPCPEPHHRAGADAQGPPQLRQRVAERKPRVLLAPEPLRAVPCEEEIREPLGAPLIEDRRATVEGLPERGLAVEGRARAREQRIVAWEREAHRRRPGAGRVPDGDRARLARGKAPQRRDGLRGGGDRQRRPVGQPRAPQRRREADVPQLCAPLERVRVAGGQDRQGRGPRPR